jgi:hypothetical protein
LAEIVAWIGGPAAQRLRRARGRIGISARRSDRCRSQSWTSQPAAAKSASISRRARCSRVSGIKFRKATARYSRQPWSLTSLREKLIKIGAKVVNHGRYVTFQMAEVAVLRQMFPEILHRIDRLRPITAARSMRIGSDE